MKKASKSESHSQKLAVQLERLHELSPAELRERWHSLFGAAPPPKLRSSLLVQAIAYRLQEKTLGGLKPATERLLQRSADAAAARRQISSPPERVRAGVGTVLIREWHGTQHQVTVLKEGFFYRAKHFRSLSQIAHAITGSRWSGPLFFGLKSSRKSRLMQPRREQALRCAIYTRKSSEEGLEQEFNSLHAQREACEAYIRSQQGEGWRLRKTAYDDGGLSGATMERPALKQLLADIEAGLVDVVVVYKVDRLTRSLSDFVRMVEIFDEHQVSFVAVTQQFNTTTSMGRLTLNVLLSFAQFEREVTGERIRDKIAASKRKGMWMGGLVPLGYAVRDRQLAVVESEAATVRHIFQRYCALGSVRLLKAELDRDGLRSKLRISGNGSRSGDKSFSRGALYTLLRNPIYVGEVRHKGARYPGLHQPIVERSVWDKTQELLLGHTVRADGKPSESMSSPLIGKLFDDNGERLTPSHAVKGQRRYRYYVSRSLMKGAAGKPGHGWRIPAVEIEGNLAAAVAGILDERTAIVADVDAAVCGAQAITSILASAAEWSARLRTAAEAATALKTLVERADLHQERIRLSLRLPFQISGQPPASAASHLSLTRQIPLKVRRRGNEMRLVIGGVLDSPPKIDSAILKATAPARRWLNELVSGRAASMVEIGQREGVGKRYVSRMIRLAFLAPAIIERIAEGRQPPELTTQLLSTNGDLPLSWRAQEQLLGFADPA